METKMTKAELKEDIVSKLTHIFGVNPEEATYEQYYKSLAIMCKDMLAHEWYDFRHELHRSEDTKTVYYLCMEFLLGRSLKNNLYNLNLTQVAEEALQDFGITLDKLYECEPDAGLGNGGLGRLAACYLDGLATGGYSSMGYGILYNGYKKRTEVGGSYYYFHSKEHALLYGLSCIEHALVQYAGLPASNPVVKVVQKQMVSMQTDNRILGTMA